MADTVAAVVSASRAEAVTDRQEPYKPDRLCLICGDPIEDWRSRNACLCHDCAAGRKKRTCELCGKTFRSRRTRLCRECRIEKQRQGAKDRWARIRAEKGTLGEAKLPQTPLTHHVETGVNSGQMVGAAIITHEHLLALRLRLSMSQSEFGRALGATRGYPYARSYISKLESGKVPIASALQYAFQALNDPTKHLRVLPAKVYAVQSLPPGTVVLGKPIVCPVCKGIYVMPWPTQLYCGERCKRLARREQQRRRLSHRLTQAAPTKEN
jgi:hypothetical protein